MAFIRTRWALMWRFFATLDIKVVTQCVSATIDSFACTIECGGTVVMDYGIIVSLPVFNLIIWIMMKKKKKTEIEWITIR